ncbi:hypothetical protein [Maricaulis virginensis]|uniref:hypothetical protein n=1 Tax=Maricaulis virginensis TaxID=144022 RepID=UPI0022F25220|nr:hypothetical protein [Maricaulis virginensis]
MKIYRLGLIFVSSALLGSAAICRPAWLSENSFLDSFVSHEIMAFLIVVLTITFASVANLHLSLARTIERLVTSPERRAVVDKEYAEPLRADLNSSAWLLFWAFVVCAISLVVKGQFDDNDHVVAFVHAVAVEVTIINGLVLHDIYRTVFIVIKAATVSGAHDAPMEPSAQDSPPAAESSESSSESGSSP